MNIKYYSAFLACCLACFLLIQCKPARNSMAPTAIIDTVFTGNFTDDYGIRYTISPKEWVQHPGIHYKILEYHPEGPFLIAQNDHANPTDGGLFTRIDITRFTDMEPWRWGFCLTAYKAPDIKTAINTAAADRQNPRKGCGGYPFSRMKRY